MVTNKFSFCQTVIKLLLSLQNFSFRYFKVIQLIFYMLISEETKEQAKKVIKEGQGCKLQVYKDSAKEQNLTIGIGHKLNQSEKTYLKKITPEQAQKIFQKDFQNCLKQVLKVTPNFSKLNPSQQIVLLDMTFNLGPNRLSNFKKMISHIQKNQPQLAAYQLLESSYRVQVKSRAYRNSYILKSNKILTKQQAIDLSLRDKLLSLDENNKITYSNQKDDSRIKNILNNVNNLVKTDEQLAKQADNMKQAKLGGVSFNFDPVSTTLNGFIYQGQEVKIIEGDIYDSANYTLMDLVTPLKIMYDEEIKTKNISVSLDPLVPTDPEGPWFKKTFYPPQLKNTRYGEDMIEADFLMKQLSLGVNQDNKPYDYPQKLKQMGLQISTIFNQIQQKTYQGSRTRLWIVIKDYQLCVNERFFQIKNIIMGVQLKALQIGPDGRLKDCTNDPSPLAKRFCQIFTKNYDELSKIYPILSKMKRLAKASIIAKLMYMKRVQISTDLINRLFQKQKKQFADKIPRLHNTLRKQTGDKIIQMSVFGGCTFDISNMQKKIQELDSQVKQIRKLYQQKKINSNSQIPLKFKEEQKIGQVFFVKNEVNHIKNNQVYAFLFQNLVKCKKCNKVCNLDYYSVTNKQCPEHSRMKCKICKTLVLPGQQYKTTADFSTTYHQKCLVCKGCRKAIQGQFVNVEGSNYHNQCIPKKIVGTCSQCNISIYQTQPYAQNPITSAMFHPLCAQAFNKKIQDSIPSCKQCNTKLQGQYVKYKNQPYHESCITKKLSNK